MRRPDLFDLARATAQAQKREGEWTVTPEAGGADPWADGPVDAFCQVLAGIAPILLPPKQRKQWARKLAWIAGQWSSEDLAIGPGVMEASIRAVPDSDIGWKTYKSPFAGSFETDIGPLLLNGGVPVNGAKKKGQTHAGYSYDDYEIQDPDSEGARLIRAKVQEIAARSG